MSDTNCTTMNTRDWSLCFICQSEKHAEPATTPASSIKLRNNPENLFAAYKDITDNIQELQELGELPDFVVSEYCGGGDGEGTNNVVDRMMTNTVVWHKSCRNAVDNQKVTRARTKHQTHCSPVKTRRMSSGVVPSTSSASSDHVDIKCIFCDQVGTKKELRTASTLDLDRKVRECAKLLGDKCLMLKLSVGDMIAIDAVYHRACLVRFYRKAEYVGLDINETPANQVIRAQVLNELVDYIEGQRFSGTSLEMTSLTILCDTRLEALGYPDLKSNTTRLRKDIERMIPDIKPILVKRGWSLVFDEDLSTAVCEMKENTMTEVSVIHKAAKILRRECLQQKQSFTGSFPSSCETDSIPPILRSFLHMTLDGSGIDQPPPESEKTKTATSIGQQIVYNIVGRRSKKRDSILRHMKYRETPAAIYMAMKLHIQTGRASLVDTMHQRGLCISYDRLRVVSTDIANSVIGHWERIGVVVPPQCVKSVFSTGAFDNIDHNPSSTLAKSALHGTCISIHQHFSSDHQQIDEGLADILNPEEMGKKDVRPLPVNYTNMDLEVSLSTKEVLYVPSLPADSHPRPQSIVLSSKIDECYEWLKNVRNHLSTQVIEKGEWISWAAYYAGITEPPITPPTHSYMLPLFLESPNSPAMVWHGMNVIRQAINHINPGQTPVMVADQPLFTLAKKLQWKYPDTENGENAYLVTLGAMHTEKMLWTLSGDWLDGSGWTTALTNSGISTSGKAQSFIGVHHICRTRYMHQVSVAALYVLLKKVYDLYVEKMTSSEGSSDESHTYDPIPLNYDEWINRLRTSQPQTDYWLKSMELDLLILQFVKSCRTADFSLYMESIDSLMPWVFALDHTHYARNLPIHLRDMATLSERHPAIYDEFRNGHFMGQKSKRAFSKIPRDQMHEQLIDWLKNMAGVIENLDDPRTVRREQVVRPEMARLVREFEGPKESDERRHHEQYHKFQADYKCDVLALVDSFECLGNPFLEDSGELLSLDESIIMPPEVTDSVRNVTNIGLKRYDEYMDKRINSQDVAFTAPVQHTKLHLFKAALSQPRRKSDMAVMKDQQGKVTQILLAANSGRNISESVFAHESSTHPPSLTRKGHMHHGTKSEILDCIVPQDLENRRPDTTAVVLDGAVIIHMLRPGSAVTIGDYFKEVFLPYVVSWFDTNNRVDIVWDVYTKTSLKSGTREQRGSGGARRRVTPSTKIPGHWASFLRVDMNKQELFVELSQSLKLMKVPQGKELFTTILNDCACVPGDADVGALTPCTHEEADTRIFLHVSAATKAGHRRIIIRSSDSDVVVLAVSTVVSLQQSIYELWIAFGSHRHFRYIPVHTISSGIGPAKAMALPAFHALTGCDTTSAFYGKGKKTAWSVWQSFPEVTTPLQLLSRPTPHHDTITTCTPILEKFIVKLYGVCDEDIRGVDAARLHLFVHKGKDFDHIPPGSDALHQHLLRVGYQSGHVWGNSLVKEAALVSPTEWGWQQDSPDTIPTPVYTTHSIISRDLSELVAYKLWTSQRKVVDQVPGLPFTGDQLYFISLGRWMCEKMSPEAAGRWQLTDVYSLFRHRLLIQLQNSPEFSHAFKCPVGSPMNPVAKCQLF